MTPLEAERHFPWYIDAADTTNIDCQCGEPCDGVAGWATHITNQAGDRNVILDEHRIETTVKVYLSFDTDDGSWVVDPITMDGAQLDGIAADDSECECERGSEHQRLMDLAAEAPLPTGAQLIGLMLECVLKESRATE